MHSLLERELIVVTGKGGVGKSTLASALGVAAAARGLRTIVVELGGQHHLPDLFAAGHDDGREIELQERLWSSTIDPDRALAEWLQTLTGRISARLLASSSTFQYFAAAAPGVKELTSMIKLRELCAGGRQGPRGTSDSSGKKRKRAAYDLVVLDAPASGHALALLRSPQTFSAIVRVGPLAEQAQQVRELLEDPARTGYVAVTHANEMAVTETLELEEGLRREMDRDLDVVIVNGTMPRRFTKEELERISAVAGSTQGGCTEKGSAGKPKDSAGKPNGSVGKPKPASDPDAAIARSAAQMARTVNDRARVQLAQIARLRRQRFAEGEPPVLLTVPFVFAPECDLDTIREVGNRLASKL